MGCPTIKGESYNIKIDCLLDFCPLPLKNRAMGCLTIQGESHNMRTGRIWTRVQLSCIHLCSMGTMLVNSGLKIQLCFLFPISDQTLNRKTSSASGCKMLSTTWLVDCSLVICKVVGEPRPFTSIISLPFLVTVTFLHLT